MSKKTFVDYLEALIAPHVEKIREALALKTGQEAKDIATRFVADGGLSAKDASQISKWTGTSAKEILAKQAEFELDAIGHVEPKPAKREAAPRDPQPSRGSSTRASGPTAKSSSVTMGRQSDRFIG